MGILVTDNSAVWRKESKLERAIIKILQTQISFKFRRSSASRKSPGYGLPHAIRYQLLRIVRAD